MTFKKWFLFATMITLTGCSTMAPKYSQPAFASGAGAGAQKAIGTVVPGAVVTSAFLFTIFAPLFYVLIEKTFSKQRKRQATKSDRMDESGGDQQYE